MSKRPPKKYSSRGLLDFCLHVHIHNGYLGKLRLCYASMQSIMRSVSTTQAAKFQAERCLAELERLEPLLKERVDPDIFEKAS